MARAPQITVQPAARGHERTAVVTFSQLGDAEVQAHVCARVGANGPELTIATDPGVRVRSRCVEAPAVRFTGITAGANGFTGKDGGNNFAARWDLFLIREAWHAGCDDLEHLCDGYGPGAGTHGDWSGIRDSSPEAIQRMTEAALNFLFPGDRR